jgi:SAM-dependent methyltransferase
MTLDAATAHAYATHARDYATDWLGQPPPVDLQDTVRRFFRPGSDGGTTADIGSGSGRDVDWLNRNGYPCVGYEPIDDLRVEATARFPDWAFLFAELPDLDGIATGSYDNVLCETVVMHLPRETVAPAIGGLRRILKSGGTLYLSWRVSDADERDTRGRLYTAFDVSLVERALRGITLTSSVSTTSASSGKRIHAIVARS